MADIFEQLRQKFDGADSFVAGGHSVRGGGFTRHAERIAHVPEWANDDVFVRQLLLQVFPKLTTNRNQRERAGAWMRIITMYYRMGLTRLRIATETGWSLNKVKMLIRNVSRAAKGLQTDTGNPRGLKRRGRPKNTDTLQAPYVADVL